MDSFGKQKKKENLYSKPIRVSPVQKSHPKKRKSSESSLNSDESSTPKRSKVNFVFDNLPSEESSDSDTAPPGLDKFRQNLIDSLAKGDSDDEDDEGVKITPDNIPRGFEDAVQDENGEYDFEKLNSMSKSVKKNGRVKKVLESKPTMDEEDFCVDNDEEGFEYGKLLIFCFNRDLKDLFRVLIHFFPI